MVKIDGSSFPHQYRRTNPYPIDSTETWATIEDATAYAQNIDAEAYMPYPGQVISIEGESDLYVLVDDDRIPNTDGRGHFKLHKISTEEAASGKYLRKDKEDTAEKLIHFQEGADVVGPLSARKAKIYDEIFSVNYAQHASGWLINKEGQFEANKAILRTLLQVPEIIASKKITTLNLLVQTLAETYNLSVSHVATLIQTIVKDYVSSEKFVSGFAGEGMRIYKALDGKWNMELDNLTVRGVFSVFEIIVQKITHQGGMVIRSAAGGKLISVADGGSYWRCEHDSTDDFTAGDQVICQTFTGGSKRYWRLVTSAGSGYFNLSKNDCDTGSDSPAVGDEVAVLGNRTDPTRQKAQIDCAVGSVYRDDYAGISSYSLEGCLVTRTGELSGITDAVFGVLSGFGLYATNVYLKGMFILRSGKTVEGAITDGVNTGIAGIKIGGRNLILNSKEIIVTPSTGIYNYKTIYTFKEVGTYTFSADFEIYTGSSGTQGSAFVYDFANNKPLFSLIASSSERKTLTFNLTVASPSIQLILYAGLSGSTSGVGAKWKNVKLEKGNKATDWTPAPEDIENRVTTVETNFEIREGQISSKVTEVITAASNAKKSETSAAGSASTATSKAGEAAASASNAGQKAADATKSATDAKAAEDAAEKILEDVTVKESSITQTAGQINLKVTEVNKKVTEANTAASTATTKAGEASTSASNAAAKANAAASSATAAKGSADAAAAKLTTITEKESSINQTAGNISLQVKEVTTKTTEANTAASNAKKSETAAAGSASSAGTKAGEASTSASNATAKANAAAASATAAKGSADAAAASLQSVTTKESSINQTASKITLQVSEVTTKADAAAKSAELAAAMGQGKMLYTDPTFASGYNSTSVYNNSGGGTVAVTRVNDVAGNPNDSGYCLKITTTGTASPGFGGFCWGASTKANRILVARFVAKIPVGRSIQFASNATGVNPVQKWLTSREGTGDWAEYAFKLVCGSTGTFSSTMYFYLHGGSTPTSAAPITWYVCYATVYDLAGVANGYFVTKTVYDSGIKLLKDSIDLKVSSTTFNTLGSRVTAAESAITVAQNAIEQRVTKTDYNKVGRLVAEGTNYDITTGGAAVTLNDTLLSHSGRGFNLFSINRATLAFKKVGWYDVYAGGANLTNFVNALNAVDANYIVVVTSADAITVDATTANALAIYGGSGMTCTQSRRSYVLIGQKGIGKGNGLEQWKLSTAGSVRISTTVINGAVTGFFQGGNTASTLTNVETRITQTENSIKLKANQTVVDGINTRLQSAEAKITPDAIKLTVKSQTEDIAKTATKRTEVLVDTTGLDASKYYPVTIDLSHGIPLYTITVSRPLDPSFGKPSWSTHDSGFSLLCKWSTNASGWGSISVVRTILDVAYSWTNAVPAGSIGQITEANLEYIYVRGGSKYRILVEGSSTAGISLKTASYTWSLGGTTKTLDLKTEVTTPVADLKARPTTDTIKSQIVLDGFGISIFGKKIDFTGKVTFGSLDSGAQSMINRATYQYGTCDTAAATAAKIVALSGFTLFTGAMISVRFANGNTTTTPTLNVNNTGAKSIVSGGAVSVSSAYTWSTPWTTLSFVYDGTYWRIINDESYRKAYDAQTTANTAKTNAATAQTTADAAKNSATSANNLLADIANDNKLTPSEKQDTKKEWDIIVSEKTKNDASAKTFGVSNTAYGTAYTSLSNYITPLLASLTTTSAITGTDFRATFKAYYDARTDLLNAIAAKAKKLADDAQSSASTAYSYATTAQNTAERAQSAANTAQSTADTAKSNASAAQTAANNAQTTANAAKSGADSANSLLSDIASDSRLTASEKQLIKKEWDVIVSEKTKNDASADKFGVPKTTYGTAYSNLSTYITPLLSSLTTTSDIVGTTFRSKFKAYYDARTDLLNAVSAKAKTLADAAQTDANSAKTAADAAKTTASSAQTAASNVASALNSLTTSLKGMAYQDMVTLAKLDKTIIDGGHIITSLIDANAIVTGTLVAGVIATTQITTGKLNVTDGATIGEWRVTSTGLSVSGNTNANINLELGANRYLIVNDKKYNNLMRIRNDAGNGLMISNMNTNTIGLNIASISGLAIKSAGNHLFYQGAGGDQWNAPGALWAARITSGGYTSGIWGDGCKITVRRTDVGNYVFEHNMNHIQYFVFATPVFSNWGLCTITDKTNKYFTIRTFHKDSGWIDHAFEVVVIGRNVNWRNY